MTFLAILGGAVGIFALLVISSLLRGFVLVKIWGWFIVPLFHLPVLTLLPAIGLALVVGFMTYQYQYSKDERSAGEKVFESIFLTFLYPLAVLLTGWVITLFM